MTRLAARCALCVSVSAALLISVARLGGALLPEADSLVFNHPDAQGHSTYWQIELSRRLVAPMLSYTEALSRCRRYDMLPALLPETFRYQGTLHWASASPDGQYVAVGVPSALLPSEMHLLDEQGRFQWAFALEASIYGWSPDSQALIIIAENPPLVEFHYLRSRDGAGLRFIPQTRADGTPSYDDILTLSPDRTQLVFASDRDSAMNGLVDLYMLNLSDGVIRRLTTHPADERAALWCVP